MSVDTAEAVETPEAPEATENTKSLREEMLEAMQEATVERPAVEPEEEATEEAPEETEENALDTPDESVDNSTEPDEFAELAERYGEDVEALRQFSTVKDAENALALRDLARFKIPPQEAATQSPDPSTATLGEEPTLDLGDLDKDDPDAQKLIAQHEVALKAYRKAQELNERLVTFQQEQQQQQVQQVLSQCHATLDKLGTERYGDSSKKLTPVQERNRSVVLRESILLAAAKQSAGETVNLDKLIQRTDRAEFAVLIAKEEAQRKKAAVEQRAGHKLGSSARAPSDAPASGQQYTGALKNDPIFMRLAKQAKSLRR